jgi:hypothetical protein
VFRVRQARIGIERAAGDPNELIDVLKGDLKTPDDYADIVESLRQAGRTDETVDGDDEGSTRTLIALGRPAGCASKSPEPLRSTGDGTAAMDLVWGAFDRHASPDAYRAPPERSRSQRRTDGRRAQGARCAVVAGRRGATRGPVGPIVRLYATGLGADRDSALEGDVDGAWTVAIEHNCPQRPWLTLARAREKDHRADAIPIYEREVDPPEPLVELTEEPERPHARWPPSVRSIDSRCASR